MNIQIIDNPLHVNVYGYSGTALDKNYVGAIFKLSGRMWDTVKGKNIRNEGKNIWIYEDHHKVFAGIELTAPPPADTDLELKSITLPKYAYYKHIGPYNLIGQAGEKMVAEIKKRGLYTELPHIEIYGHRNSDETKLETELFMCVKEHACA